MNCNNILKVTGISSTSTDLAILTSGTHTLTNGCMYDLIVCTKVPSMTTVLPVVIQVNGVNYPLLDRIGNTVMSDQIKCRTRYRMFYGATSPHFLTISCLCPTVNYATMAATTTDTSTTEGAGTNA